MPLCEDPSSLFRYEASGNAFILNVPVSGQNWSSTGCDLSCLASLLRAFTSPIVGEAALEAHLEICSNTETVSYSATSLFVSEGFCTLYALQGYSEDLLSYFFLLGSKQYINGLFYWFTSMHDTD